MTEIPYVPTSAPFTAEQRAWLNGYFAGLCSFAEAKTSTASTQTPAALKPLLILYGSQTGSAERIAKNIAKEAPEHGFAARAMEANAYGSVDLKSESHLLMVTSTWGEGDPPDNAVAFWSYLNSAEAPDLKHLTYSVLALGDKNYSDFCGAGKKFDERFEKLGANRIHPRTECDLDYEIPAREWMAGVWRVLECGDSSPPSLIGDSSPTALRQVATQESADKSAQSKPYSRANPFPARLLTNRRLNGDDSAKDTRHIEISLEGTELSYEVGDALGVMPMNCPSLVGDILAALGCDGEEAVKAPDGTEISLRHALLRHYQITQPATSLLEAIAERAQSTDLKSLLASENKPALEKQLHGREVIDFLTAHPLARFTPEEFVALLRRLNPRLYSIASSLKAHASQVHLCVGVVRFDSHGRTRKGVCSTFLADRVDDQTPVPVFIQSSHGFRLPVGADTPIIMVGPGTGIAPFRAFLEERRTTGALGKNWLFFRRPETERGFSLSRRTRRNVQGRRADPP
jgi:sulfite reductase (NADPH) flavoprotein alpha-component